MGEEGEVVAGRPLALGGVGVAVEGWLLAVGLPSLATVLRRKALRSDLAGVPVGHVRR